MSEQAPERAPRGQGQPQGKPGSAKRGLTKKIGPLPLWAWGGLAIGGALAFYFARGPGKNKQQQPTAQPTGQASANPASLAGNYPYLGFPTTLPTQTTSTTTTGTTSTSTTGTTSDEGPGDQDKGPGGKGKTGGWKGQHNNGQGSHHGGKNPPAKKPPGKPSPPRRVNPGGPVRRKVNVPPKA